MKNRKGFTLVELVIGIVIGILVAMIAYVMLEPVRGFVFTEARRAGMSSGELAMLRMIKDIARTQEPSQITTYTSTQITFTDYNSNVVTFQLSGSDLLRNGGVLARNVQSLNLEYLDKDGLTTTVPADMRVVRVELAMTVGDQAVNLSSAERIRNVP